MPSRRRRAAARDDANEEEDVDDDELSVELEIRRHVSFLHFKGSRSS